MTQLGAHTVPERPMHPAGIVTQAGGVLRSTILGFVPAFASGEAFLIAATAVIVAVVTVGGSVLRYLRFRYEVTPDAIIVRGGVLFRFRRVVPFERIQSVDTVQRLVHRMFGVVELKIEAVGGSSTEAEISAVSPSEADLIRRTVLRERSQPVAQPDTSILPSPPEGRVLATADIGDIVLYGATGGRVALIAVFLANIFEVVTPFLPSDGATGFGEVASRVGVLGVAVAVIGVLTVSITISVGATVLRFWEFTVRRAEDRLTVERGLLDHRRSNIPLHRVQAVVVHENPLRRLLDRAMVTVTVAGQHGERRDPTASIVLPIGHRAEALALASTLLETDASSLVSGLDPAPRRALGPRLVWAIVLTVPWAVPAAILLAPWGLFALVAPPLALCWAAWTWRWLGTALTTEYVVVRSGLAVRQTRIVPIPNVQAVHLRRTPLGRAFDLADVRLGVIKLTAIGRQVDRVGAERLFSSLTERLPAA